MSSEKMRLNQTITLTLIAILAFSTPSSCNLPSTATYVINMDGASAKTLTVSAREVTVYWEAASSPETSPFWNFLQYLWTGDILGFIIACFTYAFGSPDVFFAVAAMIPVMAIYIRTKSLLLLSIMWILVGGIFLAVFPLVSPFAVLFLVLGIGSMLFQLFTSLRD